MKKHRSSCASLRGGVATLLMLLAAFAASADSFIIESRSGGLNYSTMYSDLSFANSSLKSSASGCTAGIGSRYGFSSSCTVTLNPTMAVAGGSYLFQLTHGSASSISSDIIVTVALTGAVFTNAGSTATYSTTNTTAFQQPSPNTWKTVGTILLDEGASSCTITCTTTNADLNSSTNRFYSDAYQFTYTGEPCLGGLPVLYAINGPLYAGQTSVNVPGVSAQATNINVYTNGVLAGSLRTGIVAGSNLVPTVPLLQGSLVTATETGTNGIESCQSSQGTEVGGGANPQIRVSLSLETDTALTGPIGAAGTSTSGDYFFLDATGTAGIGGFGTAPAGGTVIYPSTNWQTVTFDPTADSGYYWAGAYSGSTSIQGTFAQLDAIAFCIDDLSNTGPFAIYIDDIENGSNVIQNFDSIAAGTQTAQFLLPSSSGTTSANLLAQPPGVINPNISMVVSNTADSGPNCCLVSWQFNSTAAVNWVRLSFAGTGGGTTALPMVDLSQQISFNMLLVPVGAAVPPPPPSAAPPTLSSSFHTNTLTLNWSGNYYLQTRTNLNSGSWSDVGVTNGPYSVSVTNGKNAFFRLSKLP
jgi:hypothetical protein